MNKCLPVACLILALALPAAAAEEPHNAVKSFKDFVAALEAKDRKKAGRFIPTHTMPALAKSGKRDELFAKFVTAAGKDGATLSFEGDVANGDVVIQPGGVRVPVRNGGDHSWSLDVAKLIGEVAISEEERDAYRKMQSLAGALNFYKSSSGTYPSTEQGLRALIERPTTEPIPKRWLQLRSEIPKDHWGNDFVYESTTDGFTLRSLGPDGKGSADDIVSPF